MAVRELTLLQSEITPVSGGALRAQFFTFGGALARRPVRHGRGYAVLPSLVS